MRQWPLLSPHPELVTSSADPDTGDMVTHLTMAAGEGVSLRVTSHLLSNYSLSGFFEIIDQDVSEGAPANKATVGQPWPCCSQGQALNGYNSMFYDPPPARLLRAARSTYAQECLQSREILKVVNTGRHFSDTGFAADADWAGL